jgi:hypothetical protein
LNQVVSSLAQSTDRDGISFDTAGEFTAV